MAAVLAAAVLGEIGRFTSSDLRFNAAFKGRVESPHHCCAEVVMWKIILVEANREKKCWQRSNASCG
jgi:hypothetical protein